MKLHQLRIFESVARHLNVTNAAEELHISQPAVSIQLKQLQQEYKSKFYESDNHGVRLTREGQAFLNAIRPLLTQVDKIEVEFKTPKQMKKSDVLTVGSNYTISATLLPDVLLAFKKRYPDVQLVLETADSRTIESWLVSSKVEIAFINLPSYFPICEYKAYAEQEYETVAFVRPDSRFAGQIMSLKELTKHPLVVRGGSFCTEELKKSGFNLKLALQCHSPDAVKVAVHSGLGVGLLFRALVESEIAKGDLKLIDVPEFKNITFKSFVAYDKRRPLSKTAKNFIRTLQQH